MFVLLTEGLLRRNFPPPVSVIRRFGECTVAVWLSGAALRRPVQLLSFSLFLSSLLNEDVAPDLLDIPVRPWQNLHAVSMIIGCVGGAVFVPLDWGTEWQKFPIPVSIGLAMGSFAGRLINVTFN